MAARKKAKSTAKKTAKTPRKTAAKGEAKVSADAVNLGHIFALRPRVPTAFPQEALRRAKGELSDERFGSIQEAARAVAEKALETSQKKPSKHGIGRR